MCRPVLIVFALCALAACSEFPELETPATRAAETAPYPPLAPLDSFAGEDTSLTQGLTGEALASRAARLKARAEGLKKKKIITETERDRLDEGVWEG